MKSLYFFVNLRPVNLLVMNSKKKVAKKTPELNKYRKGVVLVIAGTEQYPGAAVLTVGGARRGGRSAGRGSA